MAKTKKEIGLDIKALYENIKSKLPSGYIGQGHIIYNTHEVAENLIVMLRSKYTKNTLTEDDVNYRILKEMSLFVTFNDPQEVEVEKLYGIKYYKYK